MAEYERPEVVDYGSLVDITEATALTGNEDGGSKLLIHHSLPVGA
jgi:hypothetical protein